jgi:predicted TIM-barrel fold metal-dependent hydrolase
MRVDDMIMVSIDDHVVEPPDLFEKHIPAKYRDEAPRVVKEGDADVWLFRDLKVGSPGLNAVVSWPRDEWGLDPVGFAEMRPGVYDIHQRVRDMDANGVLASMCFATFPGFNGTHLARIGAETPDLTAAVVSAFNDWHIDDWCGAYPGRFIPLAIIPLWDVNAAVDEINRVAAKGVTAISIPETPHAIGLPSFYTDHWDPVLKAVCENDMVICLHIGGSFSLLTPAPEAPIDHLIVMAGQLSTLTLNDLMVAGIFRRFPELKVALSEGGIGWVPFYLDRLTRHVENQTWTGLDLDGKGGSPTEVFRRHCLACFITDPSALHLVDRIGEDNIAWECDYPHSDSTWPLAPETVMQEFQDANVSDDQINKITYENATRFFRFDPFKHIKREEATVGALRARARDVDVRETPKAEYRKRFTGFAA